MYIYTDSSRARVCVCVFFYASSSAIIIEKEAFGKKKGCLALARVVSFLRSLAPSAISTARLFFLFLWARVSSRVREKNIIKDAFFQATQNRQRMYTYIHA